MKVDINLWWQEMLESEARELLRAELRKMGVATDYGWDLTSYPSQYDPTFTFTAFNLPSVEIHLSQVLKSLMEDGQ